MILQATAKKVDVLIIGGWQHAAVVVNLSLIFSILCHLLIICLQQASDMHSGSATRCILYFLFLYFLFCPILPHIAPRCWLPRHGKFAETDLNQNLVTHVSEASQEALDACSGRLSVLGYVQDVKLTSCTVCKTLSRLFKCVRKQQLTTFGLFLLLYNRVNDNNLNTIFDYFSPKYSY